MMTVRDIEKTGKICENPFSGLVRIFDRVDFLFLLMNTTTVLAGNPV